MLEQQQRAQSMASAFQYWQRAQQVSRRANREAALRLQQIEIGGDLHVLLRTRRNGDRRADRAR